MRGQVLRGQVLRGKVLRFERFTGKDSPQKEQKEVTKGTKVYASFGRKCLVLSVEFFEFLRNLGVPLGGKN